MPDASDNLYSQREPRLSLADEIARDARAVPAFDGNLQQQLRIMRRRRIWMLRIVVTIALIYTIGLTAFIAVIMSHRTNGRATAAAATNEPLSRKLAGKSGAAADNLADIRRSIQKWKASSEQLREARTWVQKDRRDTATVILKQAVTDDPANVALQFELGQLYLEQGDFERARELLLRVLRVEPQHKGARQMLAAAYSHLGQHEQALALANWILEDDPDDEEVQRIAGLAHLQANRLNEAMLHFRKWLVLSPDKVEAQKQYADVLMRLQEYDKAAGLYEDILKKKSTDAEVYQHLAICYAKLMHGEQTVATMVQALYIVGTPSVAKWFKDPGFDNVRTNKLFSLLERQVTAPTMAGKATQAGETLLDLNSIIDEKRLKQIQSEIKSSSQ